MAVFVFRTDPQAGAPSSIIHNVLRLRILKRILFVLKTLLKPYSMGFPVIAGGLLCPNCGSSAAVNDCFCLLASDV